MSKRNKIIVLIIIIAVLVAIITPKVKLYLSGNNISCNKTTKEFYILSDVDIESLASQLSEKGIIDNISSFVSVGKYKGLDKKTIAHGKYIIKPGTSYRALLNGFKLNSKGNGNAEVEVKVNFNNCKTMSDLANKVSKVLFLDSTKLIDYLNQETTLKQYEFTSQALPTMFIPNTYYFFYDTDEKEFVKRMAKEFKSFWNEERKAKMKEIGLTSPSEVVTLASIVYSEQSIIKDEWPIIAGLYLNRLNKGIRLQSDPTFKFCWGDLLNGVQRLLNVHRDINCEYNTYKIDGLPPGPICLPSSSVVDAVLNNKKNDFIYMCAKPDYTHRHNFAVTGAEHMKNAKKFQTWLAAEIKLKGEE